jgi:hypothetical protein
VSEFATCPFDRGTSPTGWRADGYAGDIFAARDAKAKAFLRSYPKSAYMSEVERWRELPDGAIEFTMRRLRTAD